MTTAITTPTTVQVSGGRIGVCLWDNALVTNNNNPSAYVIFADSTWAQVPRANLTVVANTGTGALAFGFFTGTGQGSSSMGPGN
jgi:hypothetical protein